MGATSKHYGDVLKWVECVIDSCETPQQELVARRLIRQFEMSYFQADKPVGWAFSRGLQDRLDDLRYSRFSKKIEQDA